MKWMMTAGGVVALAMAAMPAQAEMGGYGISAIRLAVNDDAKEIEFLKRLGMKVGRLHHPGQQEMTWEKPGLGPNIIVIHKEANSPMVTGALNLIMFVPSAAATSKALRDAGFSTIADPKPGTGSFLEHTVKDPEGNSFLLIAPNPNAAKKP